MSCITSYSCNSCTSESELIDYLKREDLLDGNFTPEEKELIKRNLSIAS